MIRMGKHIGGEEVVIPHHTIGKVAFQGFECGLGKIRFDNKAVEKMDAHIDARHLCSSQPVTFLHRQRHCGIRINNG